MADPKHPRRFTDEFKRQIVELVNAGKPKAEVMREYDLSKSTVDRWVKAINASDSPRAADNRTPEQNRIIELERENRRLRMEVDVLKQAALIFARKRRRWRRTPAATRYRRNARYSALRARPAARPAARCARARNPRSRRTPSSPTCRPRTGQAAGGTSGAR